MQLFLIPYLLFKNSLWGIIGSADRNIKEINMNTFYYNIASRLMKPNSMARACFNFPLMHADDVSKQMKLN